MDFDFKNNSKIINVRFQTEQPSNPLNGAVYVDNGLVNINDGTDWNIAEDKSNMKSNIDASNTFKQFLSAKSIFSTLNPLSTFDFKSYIQNIVNAKPFLCFTALQDNSQISLKKSRTPTDVSFEVSEDGASWTDYTLGETKTLNTNDKIYFRNKSDSTTNFSTSDSNYYQFVINKDYGSFSASGNIMSLIDKSCSATTIPNSYCFCNLFNNCTGLTSIENLTLPATTLTERCYYQMFSDCSKLLTPFASLPAETLQKYCYSKMFYNCKTLTTIPNILTTDASAEHCCDAMFYNNFALTDLSSFTLLSNTVGKSSYLNMFRICTSLQKPIKMSAMIFLEGACNGMFAQDTSLNTLLKLDENIDASNGYGAFASMYQSCENIKMATEQSEDYPNEFFIPKNMHSSGSCDSMFYNTKGSWSGTPSKNTMYYTANNVI